MLARHPRVHLLVSLCTLGVSVVVLALCGAVGVALVAGSYRVAPVLSGSMGQYAPTGSMVVTHQAPADTLAVGDVIVFAPPGKFNDGLRVHRVVEIKGRQPLFIVTKGDANDSVDAWSPFVLTGHTVWKVQRVVPKLGTAMIWIGKPLHRLILLGVAIFGVFMALTAGGPRKRDGDGGADTPQVSTRPCSALGDRADYLSVPFVGTPPSTSQESH